MTQDHYLEVDGARLRYREDGDGEAVVLVHGWTLDLQMWEPQVADLARQYRVIRFDRRGFGLSSGSPGIAADTEDVRALCRHLGVERSAFVGMSQGARVLERLTAVAPALISCLVFDGAPDLRPDGQLTSNEIPRAEYAAIVRTQGLKTFRQRWAAHPLMRLVTADQSKRELLTQMLARYQANDLRNADANIPAPHFIPASIHTPVLILNGELDLNTRKLAGAALARLVPAARHIMIPNAGHLSNLDNSITYNEELLRFLGHATAR